MKAHGLVHIGDSVLRAGDRTKFERLERVGGNVFNEVVLGLIDFDAVAFGVPTTNLLKSFRGSFGGVNCGLTGQGGAQRRPTESREGGE
jgi:hypothetical protein